MAEGTFVLADIGGYTSFLSDVGIEHAKEITSHLFNGLHAVDPEAWKVGNVEGDCLFLYSDDPASGDTAFDHVKAMYERFCEGIEEVVAGSTCKCGACDRSGDLSIKFVVHAGEFDTQEIVGRTELIGPEIVVAHRLLKNSISVREYALLTEPLRNAVDGCGYECLPAGDDYGDIGRIEYRYVDLAALRQDWWDRRAIYLDDDNTDMLFVIDVEAPPELVWEAMLDPAHCVEMYPSLLELDLLTGPVDEVGAVHTCFHGNLGTQVHHVIAVDEVNRRTTQLLSNVPILDRAYLGYECADDGSGGTTAMVRYGFEPAAVMTDEERELVVGFLTNMGREFSDGLKRHVEELARRTIT